MIYRQSWDVNQGLFLAIAALERKISVRASRDELVQKGILLPVIRSTSFPENGEPLDFYHTPPRFLPENRETVDAREEIESFDVSFVRLFSLRIFKLESPISFYERNSALEVSPKFIVVLLKPDMLSFIWRYLKRTICYLKIVLYSFVCKLKMSGLNNLHVRFFLIEIVF